MSTVYFIGDTHFGHTNVAKWRGFDSVDQHDATLIRNWNNRVGKNDIVWLLGDVSYRANLTYVKQVFHSLNGTKHVLLGNHDSPQMLRDAGFKTQFGIIAKYKMWLSHAPIHPQELRGRVNMHGHVHTATIPDDRYFNVSAEMIKMTPININEVEAILKQRKKDE
jgi:calcineurin-like phosphoesterase family protein